MMWKLKLGSPVTHKILHNRSQYFKHPNSILYNWEGMHSNYIPIPTSMEISNAHEIRLLNLYKIVKKIAEIFHLVFPWGDWASTSYVLS